MNSQLVEEINQFFRQFGIHVGLEWLKACIEYVCGELGVQQATTTTTTINHTTKEKLKQELLDQFLHADLHDIYENSSEHEKQTQFPTVENLIQNCHGKVLNQTFVLQMDSVRDISRSLEHQLEGIDFSDERSTQHQDDMNGESSSSYDEYQRSVFEDSMKRFGGTSGGGGGGGASSSGANRGGFNNNNNRGAQNNGGPARYGGKFNRMLLLNCTDGKKNMSAMEFKLINDPTFTMEKLQPGCKIAFKNVMIRRGIIMLVPGTIQILGGSVDYLVQAEKTKREDLSDRIQGKPLRSEMRRLQKEIQENKKSPPQTRTTPIEAKPKAEVIDDDAVILDDNPNFDLDGYPLDLDIPSYVVSNHNIGQLSSSGSRSTRHEANESTNSSVSLLGSEEDDDDDIEINEIIQQRLQRPFAPVTKKRKIT